MCTICRKFYKGGEGGSAVLQVLVRIFETKLKVLQMLQFIQKWREKNFPFIDPPSQPCLGDSIVYLSFAEVTFSFQNGTEKGPRGYFLGPLWSTLGSNGGCNCNCNNTVWFEMVQCSSSASDIERCSDSAQSQSVVCFWNRHRKCWWNKTLAMPKSISMAMAMSIFECLGSWMKFFWGGQGSPTAGSIPKWSGLPEYTDVTLAWQDEWEAQIQIFL